MEYEQLSFLTEDDNSTDKSGKSLCGPIGSNTPVISQKLINEFQTMTFPFIGCDFDRVYPELSIIVPKEKILFSDFDIDSITVTEIICSGICHQINWDFLRSSLLKQLQDCKEWFSPESLLMVDESVIKEMLGDYEKKERIRPAERAMLVQEIARWLLQFSSPKSVFLDDNGTLLSIDNIHDNIHQCSVFSKDPEEKKYQLLLQKLSMYSCYKGLANFCKPAVDYHLVRSYLRRGLLFPITNHSKEYVKKSDVVRKESTVAALRHMCSEIMVDLCDYTKVDIGTINQIEWNIGRSICVEGSPDCELRRDESGWLKPRYDKCPFSSTCAYYCTSYKCMIDPKYKNEPKYDGDSY